MREGIGSKPFEAAQAECLHTLKVEVVEAEGDGLVFHLECHIEGCESIFILEVGIGSPLKEEGDAPLRLRGGVWFSGVWVGSGVDWSSLHPIGLVGICSPLQKELDASWMFFLAGKDECGFSGEKYVFIGVDAKIEDELETFLSSFECGEV